MSTISKVRGILLILIATSVALLVTIVLYSQEQIRQQSSIIETEQIGIVNQLASRIDLMITNAEKILENAAIDENIKNSPDISLIDKNLHGIPESVDKEKRIVLRNILSTYQDFESIGYILPNGDIYFVEPYDLQKTLSVSNVSFRDYYKEITATHDTHVGSIIVSAATNHPVATIAVPIFSENSSMVGMLASGMDLQTIQKRLDELHSYTDERILVVDNNKALVADSAGAGYESSQILPEIGIIQDALAGRNGTTVESINGQKMFLAYNPIRAGQNTWAVVSMQPYDEVFQSVNATIQESYILTTLILIIAGLSSYYPYKGFQSQRRITKELEKANLSLIHQAKQLNNIKNALDESSLVAITDKNGTITYANKKFCEVAEYAEKELIGQNHRILKSGFHSPEFYEDLWKTISSGRIWRGELKNISKHGKYYWVKTTIVPLLDKNGNPDQYIAIRTEITDRKNAEEELLTANKIIEKRDKAKEEFSAMITHELKTPLTPIMGYCKMLKKSSMLGNLNIEQQEAVEAIERNAKQLERLIGDMLDARKLDIAKMKFEIEEFSVKEFLSNLDSSYKKTMSDKGIKFVINSKIQDAIIKSDKTRLQQVFDNLISNSEKFVPKQSGLIEVGADKNNGKIIFYVKDNGIGIPKEKQGALFQKFYQVDTSDRRKGGGTGLGLAISKGIVEKLGGKIWVESDGKTGTTFHIEFSKT